MTKVAVIYFSGYGHTVRQAQAVADGASSTGADTALIEIDKNGDVDEISWALLDNADAIIFGSPTYMGGPAWQFKKFADASSKKWMQRTWQDKLAGGFTNSASLNGDKGATLGYFNILACQQGMLWVSLGLLPSNTKASTPADPNFLGGSLGALADSPSDSSPEEAPSSGDLLTARLYGERIAKLAIRWTS